MAKKLSKSVEIYQIKITLRESRPSIWRRFQIGSDISLSKLHHTIQHVMGWTDSHLHQFTIDGKEYGMLDEDGDNGDLLDERKFTLGELIAGGQFEYQYDFGDDWEHVLEIEQTLPRDASTRYPVCMAGERACPPEDVGGIADYRHFLKAIKDPRHRDHNQYREWIGGDFNPEEFDPNAVNKLLRVLR
jgi:hypothetical protein